MPIPSQKRVIYAKNPLREVVCQIRFPKLLEIDAEVPVSFQSQITSDYPLLEIRNVLSFQVGNGETAPKTDSIKHFDFASEDGKWKVVLTSEFIALVATEYRRWEDFRDRLRKILEVFSRYYRAPFFTRIGLRYIDRISRDELGLKDKAWNDLIAPHIAGVLGAQGFNEADIGSLYSSFTWNLSEEVHATVQYGIATTEDSRTEFFIDADYYSETRTKATSDGAIGTLEKFRTKTYDLFRWSITDQLHEAMGPKPID